jgi:hypothetical protein
MNEDSTNTFKNVENSELNITSSEDQDLCNYLYPERKEAIQKTWFEKLFGFQNQNTKLMCEKNVYWCVQNSRYFCNFLYFFINIVCKYFILKNIYLLCHKILFKK